MLAVVDRNIRIELGAGYGRGRDAAMSKIIDNVMILAFKRGSYSDGLLAGTRAVIRRAECAPAFPTGRALKELGARDPAYEADSYLWAAGARRAQGSGRWTGALLEGKKWAPVSL